MKDLKQSNSTNQITEKEKQMDKIKLFDVTLGVLSGAKGKYGTVNGSNGIVWLVRTDETNENLTVGK